MERQCPTDRSQPDTVPRERRQPYCGRCKTPLGCGTPLCYCHKPAGRLYSEWAAEMRGVLTPQEASEAERDEWARIIRQEHAS